MEDQFEAPNVEVVFAKTDPKIIKKLLTRLKSEQPEDYADEKNVKTLMRYNVWTIDQFCDVSGMAVSTVNNMSRPTYIGKKITLKLDYCFPYPGRGGRGPKFILRNDKSEKFIKV